MFELARTGIIAVFKNREKKYFIIVAPDSLLRVSYRWNRARAMKICLIIELIIAMQRPLATVIAI